VVLPFGANIRLSKKIPSQAGLGGGSADAAAVLHALNELYNTRLSISKIAEIGAQIGADVPFCVYGGTFLATGFGEKLSPLVALSPCSIVIAKPFAGSPTKAAYTAFDALTNVSHGSIGNFLSALDSKELSETSNACFNIFEQCVNPDGVEEIKKTFKKCNALAAQMTGSGSAVFGIFSSRADAQSAYFDLASKFKDVFICSPRGKYKIN
jgi:4-diphosphocytidyl-2-C-methyl-D-erythritol kinase